MNIALDHPGIYTKLPIMKNSIGTVVIEIISYRQKNLIKLHIIELLKRLHIEECKTNLKCLHILM